MKTPAKEIVVAVIDDDRDYWVRMCHAVEAAGYELAEYLVTGHDTPDDVAEFVREMDADIVLLGQNLGRFDGRDVLARLGGEYLGRANPRIISVSVEPTSEMLGLCGGWFRGKRSLKLQGEEGFEEGVRSLLPFIEGSVEKLGL